MIRSTALSLAFAAMVAAVHAVEPKGALPTVLYTPSDLARVGNLSSGSGLRRTETGRQGAEEAQGTTRRGA